MSSSKPSRATDVTRSSAAGSSAPVAASAVVTAGRLLAVVSRSAGASELAGAMTAAASASTPKMSALSVRARARDLGRAGLSSCECMFMSEYIGSGHRVS